jgi:hypothetical protein
MLITKSKMLPQITLWENLCRCEVLSQLAKEGDSIMLVSLGLMFSFSFLLSDDLNPVVAARMLVVYVLVVVCMIVIQIGTAQIPGGGGGGGGWVDALQCVYVYMRSAPALSTAICSGKAL